MDIDVEKRAHYLVFGWQNIALSPFFEGTEEDIADALRSTRLLFDSTGKLNAAYTAQLSRYVTATVHSHLYLMKEPAQPSWRSLPIGLRFEINL
jgi:hypothetical protein